MNEVTRINPTAFRSYAAQSSPVSNPIDNQEREFNPEFFIDSKSAEALKNNIYTSNPTEINRPMSVDDYKTKLIRGGLQEGIDFDVMKSNDGSSVFIQNKEGNPTKAVFWHDGVGADNYSGYHDVSYPANIPDLTSVRIGYNRDNKAEFKECRYKNPENHTDLFPDNINMNTTSQEYINFLKNSNANFEIQEDVDANNIKRSFIIEANKDNEPFKMTDFTEYPDGMKFINQSNVPAKGQVNHETTLVTDGPYSEIVTTDNYMDV